MSTLVALLAPLLAIAPYYLYYPQHQNLCECKVHKPLYEFLNTYTAVCAPASPTVPKLAELPLHDVSISLRPGATLFNRPSGLDASFRVSACEQELVQFSRCSVFLSLFQGMNSGNGAVR